MAPNSSLTVGSTPSTAAPCGMSKYRSRSECLSRIQELKKINEIKPLMVNRGHMDSRRCILTADVLAGQIDSTESLGSGQEFSEFSDRQLESLFQMNFKYTTFVANVALRKLLESADNSMEAARLQTRAKQSMDDLERIKLEMLSRAEGGPKKTTDVPSVKSRYEMSEECQGEGSRSTAEPACDDFEKQLEMRISALRTPSPSPMESPKSALPIFTASQRPERARYPSLSLQGEEKRELPIEDSSQSYPRMNHVSQPKQSPVVLTAGERRLNSDVRYDGFLMRDAVKYMAPTDLVEKFLRVAEPNTSRNLETCAILLGTTNEPGATAGSPSVIRITHLFVPQQSGTSDSCEASEDSDVEVLDFALNNGLVCIGWIHTHPSQSCFLSSIDLHTSLGYQVLCNESLALVVAPTDSQYQPCGVFRLTDYGIAYLKTCQRRGFHKHSDAQMPLYEVVGPQEWRLVSDTGVSIVDRRMR